MAGDQAPITGRLCAPTDTIDKALEEGTPVRLGLGELDTTAEDAPLAIGADPDGREQGAGHDRPAVADLFVAGIENEVGDLADWPVAPGTELLVELGRRPAHLSRGDLEAAELLDDRRNLSGADALDVHLGDSKCHGPLAADAPLEGPGVKRPPVLIAVVTGLWDPQVDPADAGLQGLGFESVGIALTIGSSLMRLGLKHLLTLDLHRVIHERGEGRGHGSWAVLDEQGREVVDGRAFVLVGHRRFLLGGVSTSKKTSMGHLFNSGRRWVPILVSLRSTRTGTHRRFTERMLH